MKKIGSMMALLLVAGMFQVLAPVAASATEPVQVTVGMGGCRGTASGANYIPNPYGAGFICTDALYTNGNLGQGWAELDLVPQRVTTSLGNGAAATTSYDLNFTVDYKNGAATGYDFISPPSVNEALSDDSCTITSGAMQTTADQSERFITVHITQDKGTTCVFDWDARLALGSHLYPGSALHSHTRNENNGTQGVGNKDNSIPVPESFEAQDITKTMTATQDQQQEWLLSKEATPTDLNLGDSCDPGNTGEGSVEVTITWTKGDTVPAGQVAVHTEVTAINPSNRPIQVDVTDNIYSGTTLLDGPVTDGALVPAGTSQVVLTHDIVVDEDDAVNLNDIATAEYTDPVFPDVDIPGTTEATANATVVPSGTIQNGTVDITDSESMIGNAEFSVADPGIGSLGTYTPGTFTQGPVDFTLNGVTDSGSVTFTKTVRGTGTEDVDATLSDEANLSVGGNAIVPAVTASTTITSTSLATLTINKKTSAPADGDLTFVFDVSQNGSSVGTVLVEVADGETQSTVGGTIVLDDGTYQITETVTNGYPPATIADVVIADGQCVAETTVDNTFGPASAQVFKVTVPPGAEAGWEFAITKDGAPFDTGTTDASGTVQWDTALSDLLILADEGDYVVTETTQAGWELTDIQVNDNLNGSGATDLAAATCSFTVDYPDDADGSFSCTFTNTELGSITIEKVVSGPNPQNQSFEFTRDFGTSPVSLQDGGTDTVSDLAAGTYSAAETVPAGWDLISATCSDGSDPAAIDLAAGEDVTCTFTNTQQTATITVVKVTDPASDTDTSFPFTSNFMGDFSLKNTESKTSDSLTVNGGPYSVAETPVPAGWDLLSFTCDNGDDPAAITLTANDNVTCTATNRARGEIEITKTLSGAVPPANASYTFQLRTGASAGLPGTIEGSPLILNSGNNFQGSFSNLVPGDYQVCETEIPAGGHSSISDLPGAFAPNPPPEDNSTQCAPITVGAGETVELTIDNTPPPGGDQRTIGYWKNHASCKTSDGNQAPHLDEVLATFPIAAGQTTHGFFVGDLYVDTCGEARNLLDKRPVSGSNKKTASDPAFNLAAQLVAAQLNVKAGAGTCPAAITAINQAQALLDLVNFNGVTSPTMTTAQKTQANQLAATLDDYNNGGLCT